MFVKYSLVGLWSCLIINILTFDCMLPTVKHVTALNIRFEQTAPYFCGFDVWMVADKPEAVPVCRGNLM